MLDDSVSQVKLHQILGLVRAVDVRSMVSQSTRLVTGQSSGESSPFANLEQFTPEQLSQLLQLSAENVKRLKEAELRYAHEHNVADRLQKAFISNVPTKLHGLEIAAIYRPGSDEARVGGDFYDVFSLPDGRAAIVMADVSGKGLGAAVLTASVKYSLRAYACEVASPGLVLTRLNRTLCMDSSALGEHFITLFYAVFDPTSGRLTYSSAGHETQFIMTKDECIPLESTGPLLGIVNHTFAQHNRQLGIGDSLILFTDGLTESRKFETREFLEIQRVIDALGIHGADHCAQDTAKTLEQLALGWTGGLPQDDMALLVARRSRFSCSAGPAMDIRNRYTLTLEKETFEHDAVQYIASNGDAEQLFKFELPSGGTYTQEVRQAVAHWMLTLGFDREQSDNFLAAVTEAVANAVRFGSSSKDDDSFIILGYRLLPTGIMVDVIDNGPGLSSGSLAVTMPDPDAEAGRGIPMMKTLADDIQFDVTENGFRVRLVKYLV